ncbi:tubulin-like protein [Plasticicumulans lactativorans]|uniref:Tubulin-like protein n=1 Tax=Plasticicumulans lactativorans TaxID=1133106 RepID=A0A4R2L8R0_9GAMM|nr:tubulin-like doman-containing protein [Plasticicumulans lactativorans]TCO83492.1 tubulin-like protein [Plasticicumulans lactativorans]
MNHIVIGLGGTGGKIIRAFRKLIYQEFRREKPDGVEIGYLYVDSSSEMMAVDDPSWKILGVSTQLPPACQLLITDADLGARLDNLDNYPGIRPWIGDREQWRDILNSIVGVTLGGQKRRLGRFLFACKADRFREQVQTQVRQVQASGITEVTFHVLCGLAGGTGSGSLIDVLAQLRELYPESARYRILAYTLLPDPYPPPNWDTGNYHANGYAALLELNALSTGQYQPWDVLGVKGRLRLADPFNGCYVFGNENENGLTVDVDQELPGIVGEFLYQKIVRARQLGWATLARMENAENGDGTPETAPGGRRAERSKRFLAFGIKRLVIPEEEIGEFLGFGFARQALLQLAYNHWQDAAGFIEEARPEDFAAQVRQADALARWGLGDDHLLMVTPLLPGDGVSPKWQNLAAEWDTVLPHFKGMVRTLEQAAWLDELAKLCQKRFDEDWRALGVQAFYQSRFKARKDIAREVRLRLERELCNEWRIGARSLYACARLLAALVEALRERHDGFEATLAKVRAAEQEAQARLAQNGHKWAGIGLMGRLVGSPAKVLDAHAIYLQELYVNRTRAVAIATARAVLAEIVDELTALAAEVERAHATVQEALKRFGVRLEQRCVDAGAERDLRRHLIRFYDPAHVRAIARTLTLDQETQRTQASRARGAVFERLGDTPLFSVFNQRVNASALLDTLETVCDEGARLAHDALVAERRARVLGVSILGKLEERYGADPQALRVYVGELARSAGVFTRIDALEKQRVAAGIPAGVPTALGKFTVILPRPGEHGAFAARLKDDFRATRSGDVEILEGGERDNEICLISLSNLLPLRFLKPVAFLRERYERRLGSGDARRAALELHTEGDGGRYPSLYVPGVEEIRGEGLPYVLLARALGYLQEGRNPDTGAAEVLLLGKDADGFDRAPLRLGARFVEAWEALDLDKLDTLREAVQQALDGPGLRHADPRQALAQAVLASVEAVKAERGGNVQDAVYQRFVDAGRRAVRLLKREEA